MRPGELCLSRQANGELLAQKLNVILAPHFLAEQLRTIERTLFAKNASSSVGNGARLGSENSRRTFRRISSCQDGNGAPIS